MLSPTRSFSPFQIAARGLEAQRVAMGAATENIANATTTRTEDGTPYRLQRVVQTAPRALRRFGSALRQAQLQMASTDPHHLGGVRRTAARIEGDLGPTTTVERLDRERTEYDPDHPDADAAGYVHFPDVNVVDEMARMISANRIYEANLSTVQATKEMIKRSLEI